jgi:hypothetical protein
MAAVFIKAFFISSPSQTIPPQKSQPPASPVGKPSGAETPPAKKPQQASFESLIPQAPPLTPLPSPASPGDYAFILPGIFIGDREAAGNDKLLRARFQLTIYCGLAEGLDPGSMPNTAAIEYPTVTGSSYDDRLLCLHHFVQDGLSRKPRYPNQPPAVLLYGPQSAELLASYLAADWSDLDAGRVFSPDNSWWTEEQRFDHREAEALAYVRKKQTIASTISGKLAPNPLSLADKKPAS